ncbi:MAG: DUF402 domain-containing protein [Lachnospiraceae bacterium]|nr:DUF402 domain-containing protein [Lachnospiraceae bacterium]
MEPFNLYRKRIIPEECILLKDDTIISADENTIITSWKALKPKKDLHHGYSCFYLKEGFKVSKFCLEDGRLLYWYCDIVDYSYVPENNSFIVTDLLADVICYPDGHLKIADLDELALALRRKLITEEQIELALERLHHLLQYFYENRFCELTAPIQSL